MLDYEPFLERDADGIRAAVLEFRGSHSSGELFETIARFALLAYAPSQHAKHALLACLAAYDVREEAGGDWDAILTECAIYAAASRQPWSEPPMFGPPEIDRAAPSDVDELRAAVDEGDRLRGERWLAARLPDPDLARDYFDVAADDFEDFGHKLIVANAAWRLSEILGDRGRFAALRVGIWEMCAYRGRRFTERGAGAIDLVPRLVAGALREDGSIEAMHRLFLYDAAVQCGRSERVADYLTGEIAGEAAASAPVDPPSTSFRPRAYPLARDYAGWLQSFAVGRRLADPRIVSAARRNLESGGSFEEWSFA